MQSFLGGLLIGAVFIYLGIQRYRLVADAQEVPQVVECADLIRNGVGLNPHVRLTEFIAWPGDYVIKQRPRDREIRSVFIPLIPKAGEDFEMLLGLMNEEGGLPDPMPQPRDIAILFKSESLRSEDEIRKFFSTHKEIDGMVMNKIESLGFDERSMLERSYPSIDFNKCLILKEGESAGMGEVYFHFACATFVIIGGAAAMWSQRRMKSP